MALVVNLSRSRASRCLRLPDFEETLVVLRGYRIGMGIIAYQLSLSASFIRVASRTIANTAIATVIATKQVTRMMTATKLSSSMASTPRTLSTTAYEPGVEWAPPM